MKSLLFFVLAILAGLLVSFALVVAVELFGAVAHPLPEGFSGSQEEMCEHVERFPNWVLAAVVPAWGATAFLSAWIARRIGGLPAYAVVALLLLAAVVLNIAMLPYPAWFKIATLIAVPAALVAVCVRGRSLQSVQGFA